VSRLPFLGGRLPDSDGPEEPVIRIDDPLPEKQQQLKFVCEETCFSYTVLGFQL
jgi:hypothetical protein